MPARYEPLTRFLEESHPNELQVSFSYIESLIGRPLPSSAYRYPAWWANTATHSHAGSWMRVGWRTSNVSLNKRTILFRRKVTDQPEPAVAVGVSGVADSGAPFIEDDAIVIQRSALRGGAVRMLEDYREAEGGSLADAAAKLLNGLALERRRQLLDWFKANSPKVPGDSTDLIREDRDAR